MAENNDLDEHTPLVTDEQREELQAGVSTWGGDLTVQELERLSIRAFKLWTKDQGRPPTEGERRAISVGMAAAVAFFVMREEEKGKSNE